MNGSDLVFAKRLRVAMAYANITNAELAEKICISRQMVSGMTSGKKSPSISTLQKICDALDVSPGWLITQSPFEIPPASDGFHCTFKIGG